MFATDYGKQNNKSAKSFNDFIIDYNNQSLINNYSASIPKVKNNDHSVFDNSYKYCHYIFKLLVMIVCSLGCAWQCISILNLFFNFPSIVFVYVETMDQLLLPGITLCNSNRYFIIIKFIQLIYTVF